jgi:hypothetical protein
MSTITTVIHSCDGCGLRDDPEYRNDPNKAEVTPHVITFDGTEYDADFCSSCLRLEQAHMPSAYTARKPAKRNLRNTTDRRKAASIRTWAVKENLLKAGSKGRIPDSVIVMWKLRHDA